jgi:SAM-dependent methyltransferase
MSESLRFDSATARRIEALYLSPDAVRRRQRVLELLEPRAGERVLDVGCGPGFLCSELAAAAGPAGAVHGVDSSEAMLGLARTRCASQPWVTIERGDAARLALAERGFDAGVSVQVYEYVRDIAGALAGLFDALRPGGRAVVVDTDWASLVWHSASPERMARVLSAFEEHLAHLHLPRVLGPLLREAGFVDVSCDVLVQLNPSFEADSYSRGLLELIHDFVPGRRGVTQEEADAWRGELQERGRRGEYFFSLNQYLFVARKPDGRG